MDYLETIRRAIVDSGSITFDDVVSLRELVYSDGKIGQKEAEVLFKLRKELNDFGNLKEWNRFFIQAICDYILDDDRSPESIDDQEATWLINQIGEDEIIDDVERRLLRKLRKKARHFPSSLQNILKHTAISKNLVKKIFLLLCGNTKTMRSMEFGVSRNGDRKIPVAHIKSILDSDEDDK